MIHKNMNKERRECLCEECDKEYPVWFAPNDIWNEYVRNHEMVKGEPFLCPTCFGMLCEKLGLQVIRWKFEPELRFIIKHT